MFMVKKRGHRIILTVLGIVIAIITVLLVVNEVKRRQIIAENQHIVDRTMQEMEEYKKLGFDENEELAILLRRRIERAYNRIHALKKQRRVLFRNYGLKIARQKKIEQLLHINKDMVASYKQEIEDYINLGLAHNSKPMMFAKEKLVRLVVDVADFESKLHALKSGSPIDVAINEKMRKIMLLNQESIELYKEEIKDNLSNGFSIKDPSVCFARDCIARKVAENSRLEERLLP